MESEGSWRQKSDLTNKKLWVSERSETKVGENYLLSFPPTLFLVSEMRFELTQAYAHYPLKVACLPIPPPGHKKRAKDGTRTRDPNLGKVMLYQLSYFRNLFLKNLFTVRATIAIVAVERKTGLEPATLTLARLCSTN